MNQNGPTSLKKKESTDLIQTKALQAKAQKYHASASSDSPPKRYVFPTVCPSSSMMVSFYKKHGSKTFTGSIFNQPFLSKLQIQKGRAKATGKRNCTQDLSQSAKEVNKVRLNKLFSVFI